MKNMKLLGEDLFPDKVYVEFNVLGLSMKNGIVGE
jgi:hypothetical protein